MKIHLTLIIFLLSFASFAQFGNNTELVLEKRMDFDHTLFVDLDQDGDDDIIGNAGNRVYLIKNNGNANFGNDSILIETSEELRFIAAEDINMDGLLDIIAVSVETSRVEIWGGTGALVFNLENVINGSTDARWNDKFFNFEDLNNDGQKDMIFSGANMSHYFQHTTGFNFTYISSIYVHDMVSVGDVNNDGWPDLVGSIWENFKVALNDGTGNFPSLSAAYGPSFVVQTNHTQTELIDFDNDGDLDVVQLLDGEQDILTFLNDGMGIFTQGPTIANYGANIWISNLTKRDFNNDGVIDIAWKYRTQTPWLAGSIRGALGNGISFDSPYILNQSVVGFPTMNFSSNLGNGSDNLLLYGGIDGNHELTKFILAKETSSGIYDDENYFRIRHYDNFTNLMTFDLNNDSYIDFIKPPYFYLNQGDGNLSLTYDSTFIASTFGDPYYYRSHGDLNNDGYEDLVGIKSTSTTDFIGYWFGMSGGNFSGFNQVASENEGLVDFINVHDINNDGFLDIYYTLHHSAIGPEIHHVINQGGTGFNTEYEWQSAWSNTLSFSYPFSEYKFGENSSNPNNIDYACVINNKIYVATNNNITPQNLFIQADFIQVTDINEDGLLDIFYQNPNSGIGWVKNQGNQNFLDMGIIYPSSWEPNPIFKDMDMDMDMDVILLDDTNVFFIENIGYDNFSPAILLSNEARGGYSYNFNHLYAEDLENDGDNDVLFITRSSQTEGMSGQLDGDLCKITNFTSGINEISGTVFIDNNNNQLFDINETSLPNVSIGLNTIVNDYTDQNGRFSFGPSDGIYDVILNIPQYWSLTTPSSTYNITLNNSNTLADSLNFGLKADTSIYNSSPDLVGGFPRCNSLINMWIGLHNIGTLPASGILELNLDDSLTYIGAQYTPDSIVGNNYYWHYDSLSVLEFANQYLIVKMPDFQSSGDTVSSIVINHIIDSTGVIIDTKSDTLNQIVVCGYDPNDKMVEPAGLTQLGYLPNDQTLEYLIRFQNTGNDTVFTVRIDDQIHQNLDPATFELIGYSHDMNYHIEPSGKITFLFENILLPDSSVNFLGSQGFVKYRISMVPGLAPNEQILNRGNIYFDLNPAVITNTTVNTIFSCDSLVNLSSFPLTSCEGDSINISSDFFLLDSSKWFVNNIFNTANDTLNFVSSYPADTIIFVGKNDFCNVDSTIIITVNEVISPDLQLPYQMDKCEGETISLSSNYTSNNEWYFNGLNVDNNETYDATQTGEYVLIIDDGVCSGKDSVNITFHPIPTPNIYPQDTLRLCQGENSILVSPYEIGNTWYLDGNQISINDSILVDTEGLYLVQTTNTFCSIFGTDSVEVIINPLPIAEYEFTNINTVHSVYPADFYYWLDCDNSMNPIPGENGSSFTANTSGNYALTVTNEFGCSDTTECFSIITSGISEISNKIKISPNPASSYLIIDGIEKSTKLFLYDATGREVLKTNNKQFVDLTDISNGTYFLHIQLDGTTIIKKLVVLHE